jgi:hypothetical protein
VFDVANRMHTLLQLSLFPITKKTYFKQHWGSTLQFSQCVYRGYASVSPTLRTGGDTVQTRIWDFAKLTQGTTLQLHVPAAEFFFGGGGVNLVS